MIGRRRAHVIEKKWQVGGFHAVRHLECRCGWSAEHYNAGVLLAQFKEHQAESGGA